MNLNSMQPHMIIGRIIIKIKMNNSYFTQTEAFKWRIKEIEKRDIIKVKSVNSLNI